MRGSRCWKLIQLLLMALFERSLLAPYKSIIFPHHSSMLSSLLSEMDVCGPCMFLPKKGWLLCRGSNWVRKPKWLVAKPKTTRKKPKHWTASASSVSNFLQEKLINDSGFVSGLQFLLTLLKRLFSKIISNLVNHEWVVNSSLNNHVKSKED